jgi:hypothetical protein
MIRHYDERLQLITPEAEAAIANRAHYPRRDLREAQIPETGDSLAQNAVHRRKRLPASASSIG